MFMKDCEEECTDFYVEDIFHIEYEHKKPLKRQNAVDVEDMKENETKKETNKKIINEDCLNSYKQPFSRKKSSSLNNYHRHRFHHSSTSFTQSLNMPPSTTCTLTLVRGSSCSLVDIPSYLTSTVEMSSLGAIQEKYPRRHRPRLQIDLTRKRFRSPKKCQRTVFCVEFCILAFSIFFIVYWICFP